MHCGFLFPMCKIFSCSLLEIPGRLVEANYEILADTPYAIWNPLAKNRGYLVAQSATRDVLVYNYTREDTTVLPYLHWHEQFQSSDFIILPMIFRAGACVYHTPDQLGIIVPWADKNRNFNEETGLYHYVVEETGNLHDINAVELAEKLVPVGVELYIDIQDSSLVDLLVGSVPQHMRNLKYLLVRLNVPSVLAPPVDKVYVTYLLQNKCTGANTSTSKNHTFAIDVWKLVTTIGDADYLSCLVY